MQKIKFKRINVNALAIKEGVNYYSVDILRQTSVKRCVDEFINAGCSKNEIIEIMLSNTDYLLNKMIIEDEMQNG